jgi:undecaprenyl-diphosphatase
MEDWLRHIMTLLPDGGRYFSLLFLVAFAESLPLFGLLVPGSTLIVLAGFLVVAGKGTFTGLFIAATSGALLGDLFSLWLGHRYGSRFLQLRVVKRRRALIRTTAKFFVDHGGKSLFFARFLGPIRGIVPFVAGLIGIPWRSAHVYILISALLWGLSYPGLGYLGGSSLKQAQGLGLRFGLGVLALLVVVLIHYQVKRLLSPPATKKKS